MPYNFQQNIDPREIHQFLSKHTRTGFDPDLFQQLYEKSPQDQMGRISIGEFMKIYESAYDTVNQKLLGEDEN